MGTYRISRSNGVIFQNGSSRCRPSPTAIRLAIPAVSTFNCRRCVGPTEVDIRCVGLVHLLDEIRQETKPLDEREAARLEVVDGDGADGALDKVVRDVVGLRCAECADGEDDVEEQLPPGIRSVARFAASSPRLGRDSDSLRSRRPRDELVPLRAEYRLVHYRVLHVVLCKVRVDEHLHVVVCRLPLRVWGSCRGPGFVHVGRRAAGAYLEDA